MARAGRANNRFDRIILVVCAALSLIALLLPVPVREPIGRTLRRTLLAPMVMLQERAELSRRAFLNHEQIMSMRDSAAMSMLNTSSLRNENDQLRALLGLGSRLRWGFIPVEALHGRGVRDESSVILSAGSQAGVQVLSPVVAPEGLVGVVDNVDPTMSHAMLWTHQDFRVSAMSEDGSAFGIVQGRLADGPGKYLMEMRGVPFRTSIKPGTLVITSGLGGVYPRGIPLGRVIDEIKTNESWARTYIIRPQVFPADVYSVMILRSERVAEGLENVWMAGMSDSTVGNIVAAGDSLARAAALAESQARQAVQDSIRQDSIRRATMGIPIPVNPNRAPTVPPGAPRTRQTPRPVDTLAPTSPTQRPITPRRDTTRRRQNRDTADLPTTI